METNKALVYCYEKILEIRLNGVTYFVNLLQGDLPDNWNSINYLDGNVWDVNLHWDEEHMETPSLTIYEVDEEGATDFFNQVSIPVFIIGTKEQYFN